MQKKSEKTPRFCENMSPCHAFTSPSCSLREKSSLPNFCKCGEHWLLVFFISYCRLCQRQAVCYYYMPVPTKYHWNISFQKKCSSKYVVKNDRNVTQFVWQPFSIEFQGFVKKRIKYIHQNLRYYETIEQMHFMVVKIESYVLEKKIVYLILSYTATPFF
jgi:hypothetical protein